MKTILFILLPCFTSLLSTVYTWLIISFTSRFLTKPSCPVAQKAHFTGQPTCDDMHRVFLLSLCLNNTVSMVFPSSSLKRNFSVLSILDICCFKRFKNGIYVFSAKSSLSLSERFVISLISLTIFWWSQLNICFP